MQALSYRMRQICGDLDAPFKSSTARQRPPGKVKGPNKDKKSLYCTVSEPSLRRLLKTLVAASSGMLIDRKNTRISWSVISPSFVRSNVLKALLALLYFVNSFSPRIDAISLTSFLTSGC